MIMKQLRKYTSTRLSWRGLANSWRVFVIPALAALTFMNPQTVQAQTAEQLAQMPNAFEYIETPASVIGNGEYYYIQFYNNRTSVYPKPSYLTDCGSSKKAGTKDFLPSDNRLWTMERVTDNQFKLKSKTGHYIGYATFENASRFRYGSVDNANDAVTFEFQYNSTYGYSILDTQNHYITTVNDVTEDRGPGLLGRYNNNEWNSELSIIQNDNTGKMNSQMHIAKLKSNAAFIIYYRGEHADGKDNTGDNNTGPSSTETRHYLTYSGTGNESPSDDGTLRNSTVSSRQSIIPSDKPLCTLPTLAAYHQDGLWTIEEAGSDGEFYIKKYNSSNEYVNADGTLSVLGTKNDLFGKYVLEDPTANRYSRIQNIQYQTEELTAAKFNNSDVVFHINQEITSEQANQGYTVVGNGNVNNNIYADLSNYTKMVINGTQNMQLRVLMNRQWYEGPLVEKLVTIGNDGKAEVDLTNLTLNTITTGSASVRMTYIDGNDGSPDSDGNDLPNQVNTPHYDVDLNTPVVAGYNTIKNGMVDLGEKKWGVNNIIYLRVDASFVQGRISKATLKANASGSTDGRRATVWGAGYNNSVWSNEMTWNTADRTITDLTPENRVSVAANTTEQIELDITGAFTNDADNIATILVYELAAAGGNFSNPMVELEYYPTVSEAPHLNAIKTNWGSPSGTITGITLVNENLGSGSGARYLHHAKGDGWQVLQWTGNDPDYWYAGFYPVEVPVPNKDNFFQVLLGLKEEAIKLKGATKNPMINPYAENTLDNLYGATFTPSVDLTNVFQYKTTENEDHSVNISNALQIPSGYISIRVDFEGTVSSEWYISGIVNGSPGWQKITTSSSYHTNGDGTSYYEMDLSNLTNVPSQVVNGRTVHYIPDFTIFNMNGERTPITITRCYFSPAKTPASMITHNGGADTYTEDENDRHLFQLEQVDDYTTFRLKAPDGRYVAGVWQTTEPNDPSNAEIYTNRTLMTKFTIKWFVPADIVDKEIVVDGYVRHKESYLRQYADDQVIANQEGLRKQGLSRDIDSDWKNFNGNLDGMTQKTNHFEITHYMKKGDSKVIEFPTVLNRNNDHIYFQRFYNYDELDTEMNLDNLKAHVNLDTRDDGDVQYFLYNNGMVTGQKLDWRTYDNEDNTYTAIPDGGMARNEQRRFNFTNSDGQPFTVAVDVSRYSDLEYLNTPDHLAGDLREPSLTMRYLFYMNDAKDMANRLTACPEGGSKWLEEKVFHFGKTQVTYTKFKKVGYRGEFIGVRHVFSDYWVYDDPRLVDPAYLASLNLSEEALSDYLDQHLVSAVNDNNSGKIEVEVIPGNTGIRKGGYNAVLGRDGLNVDGANANEGNDADYQGFYFYDLLSPSPKYEYGNSRFVVFRYPEGGIAKATGENNPAYLNVYLNAGGQRYQLAHYTIIFDANMATRPWTEIKNGVTYANGINKVKAEERDPNNLRKKAGKPIAKITFDYPIGDTYHYPSNGDTRHDGGVQTVDENGYLHYWENIDGTWLERTRQGVIDNSSPIPLTFDHTNYSFDGDGANWGSYAIVTGKNTVWGHNRRVAPADDAVHGYNLPADPGMQKAFLYIDASEQPGDICAVDFEGEFCPSDKLMCSGWISGSNRTQGDTRCPGGITVTIKGEDINGKTNIIYRFCPGQIYELDNGYGDDGDGNATAEVNSAGADGYLPDPDENTHREQYVVWQQFYFEFSTDQKYERYWMEINNNCVSSNGGDFMLDNIEVYTIVPEVVPEINTPLCVSLDEQGNAVTEMRLLKLDVDFNKLKSSANVSSGTAKLGFVFLEKEVFLKTLWQRKNLSSTYPTLDDLAQAIKEGNYTFGNNDADYKAAFDAALLGDKKIWDSTAPTTNMGGGVMYFQWNSVFEQNELYTFAKAVNKQGAVFRYTDTHGTSEVTDDEQWLVFNGNYPGLNWKTNTEYYIVPTNDLISNVSSIYETFNISSSCSRAAVFQIEPPYHVLGLESHDNTENYVVCEGQIPTILLNLKGYDLQGNEVDMTDLNYDWWVGSKGDPTATPAVPPVVATLENYHSQNNGHGVKLDQALATMRSYYPRATSLDGIVPLPSTGVPVLTQEMIDYLRELVAKGELVLHQKSVSVPAEPASADDPYFYLVACPIHDELFDQALNPSANEYVSYFCDEPQGLRIKVGEKAPTLKSGFVPGEHGFSKYDYRFPNGSDPVLSIRLAKKEQFETVKNTAVEAESGALNYTVNHLWLPIRNARTQYADGVIQKSNDENIYLASTNDPTWDKKIYQSMRKDGILPVVGRIVQLEAINTQDNSVGAQPGAQINLAAQNNKNRLRVYFTENFEVREGYNYTLSLPFQEKPEAGNSESPNTCDGTILINLKIVPDYEVWTGAAGNTDWNNDENWRRADGNTVYNNLTQAELDAQTEYQKLKRDELYVASAKAPDAQGLNGSPLYGYKTNEWNYRTQTDRVFRKGFAPLYCTHILMKSDEWGNAPVLYDPLDYKVGDTQHEFTDEPFPNLRDTSTPILKFDMQARRYDMWEETYGETPDRGESNRQYDLIAEMYKVNSCDEIAFQPGTELLNAHLLNYNSAWMEYQLDNKRWYLLGSPLQGTISGEWYAPTGKAKQETTYYDPVQFGAGYDRYSPAIYQRSWDKAKAVLYEVGSTYSPYDDVQSEYTYIKVTVTSDQNPYALGYYKLDGQNYVPVPDNETSPVSGTDYYKKTNTNFGNDDEGIWSSGSWNVEGGSNADEYLDRLGYKPMGGNKANVAIKGIWSNTYNDAQVDYATGGFSVMVMNHLKGNDQSGDKAIVRLPKEDTMYDYYKFEETGAADGGTDTELSDVRGKDHNRALNRGRLKTDLMLPAAVTVNSSSVAIKKQETTESLYGDKRYYTRIPIKEANLQTMNATFYQNGDNDPTAGFFTETVPAGVSHLGFYLVENPFPCGLDMDKFFTANPGLEAKYWLLTATGQHLVQKAEETGEWLTVEGGVVEYLNPNYVAPAEGETTTEPQTLTFYPNAVVAPGQGFFVQAVTPATPPATPAESITVKFNFDMQTQSRFGMIEGDGTIYRIVVGQSQVTKKMYDANDDGIPDTYIDDDYEGETIMVDTNDDNIPDTEKNVLIELVYETNETGEYITDDNGNKIPKLKDIEEDVVIYKYVPETLTLADDESTTEVNIDKEYPLRSRTRGTDLSPLPGLVITAQRAGEQSSALVMQREGASNDFLPSEDTETFLMGGDLISSTVPTVYTLCGRLATTINSIHDFRSLPLGVESSSEAPCTLTFRGVEHLGDSVAFYDAVERTLTPLKSGMKLAVSGQTQNRYYLVRSLNLEEAATETHLQIFTEGLTAKVIASTQEPITSVRCYDTAGRLVFTASPMTPECSFRLPAAGIYIIEAQTEHDRKTQKHICK